MKFIILNSKLFCTQILYTVVYCFWFTSSLFFPSKLYIYVTRELALNKCIYIRRKASLKESLVMQYITIIVLLHNAKVSIECLTAIRVPTLGHYRGDSFTNPIIITAL